MKTKNPIAKQIARKMVRFIDNTHTIETEESVSRSVFGKELKLSEEEKQNPYRFGREIGYQVFDLCGELITNETEHENEDGTFGYFREKADMMRSMQMEEALRLRIAIKEGIEIATGIKKRPTEIAWTSNDPRERIQYLMGIFRKG